MEMRKSWTYGRMLPCWVHCRRQAQARAVACVCVCVCGARQSVLMVVACGSAWMLVCVVRCRRQAQVRDVACGQRKVLGVETRPAVSSYERRARCQVDQACWSSSSTVGDHLPLFFSQMQRICKIHVSTRTGARQHASAGLHLANV